MTSLFTDLIPLLSGADNLGKFNDERPKLFFYFLIKINHNNLLSNGFNNNNPNSTNGNFNDMMQIKYYQESSNPRSSKITDIHPEFYQFVIDIAKYHRALNNNIPNNQYQKDLFIFLKNNFSKMNITGKNVYSQLLKVNQGSSKISINDLINFNDNNQITINITSIENLIPNLGNWTENVWVNLQHSIPKTTDLLKTLYLNVYNNNVVGQPALPYQSPINTLNFTINPNIFYRSLIKDLIAPKDMDFDNIFSETKNIYSRNKENKLTKNGEVVDLKKESLDKNCMSTFVKTNYELKCKDYIGDCLLGQNIDQCNKYFSNYNFWDITQKEINEMNPEMIIITLKKFGFKQYKIYDKVAKMELLKVESLNDWLRRLEDIISNSNIRNDVRNNIKLKGYLNGLISVINNNPAILNINFKGNSEADLEYNPQQFDYTSLSKIGLKPQFPTSNSFKEFELIRSNVNLENKILEDKIMLKGGGSQLASDLIDIEKHTNKYTSFILRETFNNYLTKIKISENDYLFILEKIIELSQREEQIFNAIKILEQYALISELLPSGKEVLTLDQMNDIIEKQKKAFIKKKKKEDTIFLFLKNLIKN